MLFFRAWEIRTSRVQIQEKPEINLPQLSFRHLEKNMLYLTKYIVQGLLFIFAKYWFVITTKVKRWFNEKWPKINSYFKKSTEPNTPYRHSFLRKAILESKAKIKNIREKVKEEIEVEEEKEKNTLE